ncbi:hypothetical protein ANN_23699 [Periplaneta americana]|uniref:Uncharacterized protein n=1 Tax=Periplaneta americana TaxID=6978 RepID=A0ABQ8SMR3_PERAM|nr:hypothetical protein ANN_23699 [Periplaneta americana]
MKCVPRKQLADDVQAEVLKFYEDDTITYQAAGRNDFKISVKGIRKKHVPVETELREFLCQVVCDQNAGECMQSGCEKCPLLTEIKITDECGNSRCDREVQKKFFALVSDYVAHDKYAVDACLRKVFSEILVILPNGEVVKIFSDEAASHFKQKYTLSNVTLLARIFGFNIQWNFFQSYHGIGAMDGIGGQVKRMAWMAVKPGKKIQSATEFCNIVSINCLVNSINCLMNNQCERFTGSVCEKELNVDGIGDSEMVFGWMRPGIRHRLSDSHLTVDETSKKTQPGNQSKQESNPSPSETPDRQASASADRATPKKMILIAVLATLQGSVSSLCQKELDALLAKYELQCARFAFFVSVIRDGV